MKNYGQEVKAARLKKGKSLQTVADSCGTFKGYICGIESGSVNPPSEKMTRKLVRVLGLNLDRMLALALLQKRKNASLQGILNVCEEMLDAKKAADELRKEAV